MTTLINEPEVQHLPQPLAQPQIEPKPDTSEVVQPLRLASDNPTPDTSGAESVEVSAAVQMASYRLAAVFGNICWVERDVA